MKRSYLHFTVLLLCISATGFAQFIVPRVASWTIKEAFAGPGTAGNYVGYSTEKKRTGAGNMNSFRQRITAELYDQNMNLIKESRLFAGEAAFNQTYEKLVRVGGDIWLTYLEPGKKNAVGNLTAVSLDNKTLEAGTPVVIARAEDMNKSLYSSITLDIRIIPSPDKTKQLVFVSDGSEQSYVALLKNNWATEWQTNLAFPGYKYKDLASVLVANDGLIYVSAVNTKEKKASIFVVKEAAIILEKTFELGELIVSNLVLDNANNGKDIIFGGAAIEAGDLVKIAYSGTMSPGNLQVINIDKLPIPASIIDRIESNGLASKKKTSGIYSGYVAAKVQQVGDQKPLIILECKKEIYTQNSTLGVAASIIVADFNSQRKKAFHHIPRYSVYTRVNEALEFHSTTCHNRLIIGYIDNLANAGKNENDQYSTLNGEKNAGYFLVSINDLGETFQRAYPLAKGKTANEDARTALNTVCEAASLQQ